jgi:excisionase family DNA binding protein
MLASNRWLTVAQIAEQLQVHQETVRRWLRDGRLNGKNFGGKSGYRVRQADLDTFLMEDPLLVRNTADAVDHDVEKEFDSFVANLAESLFGPVDENAPVYYGPPRWHSFDLDGQAIDALRHVSNLLPRAAQDPYLWKWIVMAMFDALHAFFGLALRRGDGAQLLTKKHEERTYKRWNEERRRRQAIIKHEPDRVDETRSLYAKTLDPERMGYLGGGPFTPTADEDSAFEYLAHLRDKLTHHGHGSRSVFVGQLPIVILECLAVIEWLFEKSGTIRPRLEERDQVREMIRLVRGQAETAARVYELEGYS